MPGITRCSTDLEKVSAMDKSVLGSVSNNAHSNAILLFSIFGRWNSVLRCIYHELMWVTLVTSLTVVLHSWLLIVCYISMQKTLLICITSNPYREDTHLTGNCIFKKERLKIICVVVPDSRTQHKSRCRICGSTWTRTLLTWTWT